MLLREELFSSAALLLGRVYAGTCDTTVETGEGVAGVRIYLEDGRYAVTDDEGKYHFEGVTPGSHVVQLDTITLPEQLQPLRCDTRVRSAGNAYVAVRRPARRRARHGRLRRRGARRTDRRRTPDARNAQPTADGFAHTATVAANSVPLTQAEVLVLLPDGLAYVPGSTALDGMPARIPEAQNGSLRFALDEIAADAAPRVTFATRGAGDAAASSRCKRCCASRRRSAAPSAPRRSPTSCTATIRSSNASATRFRRAITRIRSRRASARCKRRSTRATAPSSTASQPNGAACASSRSTSSATPIRRRSRRATAARFPDNYALSAARAQAVADYLRATLPDARIEVEGRGADEPLAAGTTPDSLARNRRVEIEVAGVRTVSRRGLAHRHGERASRRSCRRPARSAATRRAAARARVGAAARLTAALEPEIDVATLEPPLAILQPSEGFAPPVPTVRVAVAHLPGQEVRLARQRPARQRAELRRHGAERREDGGLEPLARRRPRRRREPARRHRPRRARAPKSPCSSAPCATAAAPCARSSSPRSRSSTADGRTQPVIALRVFDAAGEPARPGTLGAYRVDPPYRTWWEVETLHDNPLLVESSREPTFAVDEDGLVRILLEPTAQTGTAIVRLRFNERQEQEIRAWLEPEQRDWILVGIAEGTAAYDDLERRARAARASRTATRATAGSRSSRRAASRARRC